MGQRVRRHVWDVMTEPCKTMSFTEIALRLGMSHQAVNSMHTRILRELRQTLIEDQSIRDWLIDQGESEESLQVAQEQDGLFSVG